MVSGTSVAASLGFCARWIEVYMKVVSSHVVSVLVCLKKKVIRVFSLLGKTNNSDTLRNFIRKD